METLRIILVDDNQKFRESIKDLLTKVYNFQVIGEASNGDEFLRISKNKRPDIVLMDLSMPQIDGFEATKQYFWQFPDSKIIAVTNHVEKAYLDKLIESGFKACIFKYNFFDEIKPAIDTVMSGKLWFPRNYKIS